MVLRPDHFFAARSKAAQGGLDDGIRFGVTEAHSGLRFQDSQQTDAREQCDDCAGRDRSLDAAATQVSQQCFVLHVPQLLAVLHRFGTHDSAVTMGPREQIARRAAGFRKRFVDS